MSKKQEESTVVGYGKGSPKPEVSQDGLIVKRSRGQKKLVLKPGDVLTKENLPGLKKCFEGAVLVKGNSDNGQVSVVMRVGFGAIQYQELEKEVVHLNRRLNRGRSNKDGAQIHAGKQENFNVLQTIFQKSSTDIVGKLGLKFNNSSVICWMDVPKLELDSLCMTQRSYNPSDSSYTSACTLKESGEMTYGGRYMGYPPVDKGWPAQGLVFFEGKPEDLFSPK